MNPTLIERLLAIAQAGQKAGHGGKEAIYQAAGKELQMSRSTLIKKLKSVQPATPRKKRTDSGKTALTREEALLISGVWFTSRRDNNKHLYSLENVVAHLRSNGMIIAGRTDDSTGEFSPLSTDAISRALRGYRLHYEQLQDPTPALRLASNHPNHVWQIDASLCVLYYLKNPDKRTKGDSGLRIMDAQQYNKNKPKNVARIVNDRVWSFEIIDHTTHWIYVEYRFGGETAENFLTVMINAMQARGGADVLHGVPQILYSDPGSALVSASLINMCRALGIQCIKHKAGHARATGAVEKARDIIECDFEAGLKFIQVDNLEQLNHYARLWRMNYNRSKIHSRYGLTRTEGWLKITREQLAKAPSVEICRELAISAPQERIVDRYLAISYRGKSYRVEHVPGVCVGDTLRIARNPWQEHEARVVILNEQGFDSYHPIYAIDTNDWGYAESAPRIGERYGQMPETPAQRHLIEVEQRIYHTSSVEETEAARKVKALPSGGRFNPYLAIEHATYPDYLPRQGQEARLKVQTSQEIQPLGESATLTHVQAALRLTAQLESQGKQWNTRFYQHLVQHYPEGISESQLQTIADELDTLSESAVVSLRAVS